MTLKCDICKQTAPASREHRAGWSSSYGMDLCPEHMKVYIERSKPISESLDQQSQILVNNVSDEYMAVLKRMQADYGPDVVPIGATVN